MDNVEVEDKIKATVALNADVYESSSNNPSSAVGNEPCLSSFNSTCDNVTFTFPALQDVHKAQGNDGVGDKIKAIAALNADVHESSSNKPPDGNFSNNVKDVMIHTEVSSSN